MAERSYLDDNPLIGESATFQTMLEAVSAAATLRRPVLLIGERGTGKELVAARLHYLSRRWQGPYIRLNCAALTESLLESELFGHEAGAFTGATGRRAGRFELADSGSLFLDELATTSMRLQEKILRVVEYGEFERVGATRTTRVDARIIGATNVDLPAAARAGRFRADLLDRLAFEVITLPPLRARDEDVIVLANHFGTQMAREIGHPLFAGLTASVQRTLREYSWPGNVRELKNVVERAVYKWPTPGEPIGSVDFDPFDSPWRLARAHKAPADDPATRAPAPAGLKEAVRELEIRMIQQTLARNRFNQRPTAAELGLSYHQLRNYLRKHRLLPLRGEGTTSEAQSPAPAPPKQ